MNEYPGKERRGEHNCVQLEFIGKVKEFMEGMKGFKLTLFTAVLSILISVGSAIWWGGSIAATVSKDSIQVWNELTPTARKNELNIEKILTKLDTIKFVYAEGATGATGKQGIRGEQGIKGDKCDNQKE